MMHGTSLKPQPMGDILAKDGLEARLKGKLVISIAAGVNLVQLQSWLPTSHIIRAMPNTPCRIREGMVVISAPAALPGAQRELAMTLLQPLGRCRQLSDHHMDAATALSGSGPAFAW